MRNNNDRPTAQQHQTATVKMLLDTRPSQPQITTRVGHTAYTVAPYNQQRYCSSSSSCLHIVIIMFAGGSAGQCYNYLVDIYTKLYYDIVLFSLFQVVEKGEN